MDRCRPSRRPLSDPVGVPADAQALTVVGARDGDSIQAQPATAGSPIATTSAVVVRLIGIAAPARQAIGGKAQCFAEDAFRALLRLTPIGSRVWVIADAQLRDPDQRYLLYVWNSAGTFVNLALADGGYVRADHDETEYRPPRRDNRGDRRRDGGTPRPLGTLRTR